MSEDISGFSGIENLNGEVWREIPNFSKYYVSNMGRVVTLNRNEKKPILMKAHNDKDGYKRIALYDKAKEDYKCCFVHQLVLFAFVGEKPKGKETSHLNHNRTDNRLYNLKWETGSENQRRRVENGTDMRGEKGGNVKLREEDVFKIREMYLTENFTVKDLNTLFHTTTSTDIINLKTWFCCKLPNNLTKEEYLKKISEIKKKHKQLNSYVNKFKQINSSAKLTWDKIIEMRYLYKTGKYSYSKLQNRYNIEKVTVWRILTNRSWKEEYYEACNK